MGVLDKYYLSPIDPDYEEPIVLVKIRGIKACKYFIPYDKSIAFIKVHADESVHEEIKLRASELGIEEVPEEEVVSKTREFKTKYGMDISDDWLLSPIKFKASYI